MGTKNLNDDFMTKVIEDTAWRELSVDFNWNEQLLERYKEKIVWKMVCSNQYMLWTSSMLEKFNHLIDWEELSNYAEEKTFCPENLEKFKDNWEWSALSNSSKLRFSIELIDKYIEKWNWENLINNWELDALYTESFLNKYNQYIPASKLQDSRLWSRLVEIRKTKLMNEILTE